MPRQHIVHNRETYAFPDDFPRRFKLFKQASGLSSSEIARRLGTYPHTVWRWTSGRTRPNTEHMMGLRDLADGLGLDHLFTEDAA